MSIFGVIENYMFRGNDFRRELGFRRDRRFDFGRSRDRVVRIFRRELGCFGFI